MPVSKEYTEVLAILKEIQAKMGAPSASAAMFRGPIADPGPDPDWWSRVFRYPHHPWRINIDPGPEVFLAKDKLARLKIQQIESTVAQLQKEIEALNLQKDLLKEEYKLK